MDFFSQNFKIFAVMDPVHNQNDVNNYTICLKNLLIIIISIIKLTRLIYETVLFN